VCIIHVLAVSSQHVAGLRGAGRSPPLTTLALIWLYILAAGAPPSAIRAGVVATLVLAAGLLGRQVSPV
jgi:competence protein ComEC